MKFISWQSIGSFMHAIHQGVYRLSQAAFALSAMVYQWLTLALSRRVKTGDNGRGVEKTRTCNTGRKTRIGAFSGRTRRERRSAPHLRQSRGARPEEYLVREYPAHLLRAQTEAFVALRSRRTLVVDYGKSRPVAWMASDLCGTGAARDSRLTYDRVGSLSVHSFPLSEVECLV